MSPRVTCSAGAANRALRAESDEGGKQLVQTVHPSTGGGGGKKSGINPMKQRRLSQVSHVSLCGAKTRAGARCRRPPVRGRKRCRLHGGLSPGAPRGNRNGNYRRGDWTIEVRQERKWVQELLRSVLKLENPDEWEEQPVRRRDTQ
jgi:hypothetical protein